MRGHFYSGDVGGLLLVGFVPELGFDVGPEVGLDVGLEPKGVEEVPLLPGPFRFPDPPCPPPRRLTELARSSIGS